MIFNTTMYYTEEAAIKISLPIPKQTGKLYYTGNPQTPTWENYDPKTMSISGDTIGTADGAYTAIFSIIDKETYVWIDGTNEDKYISWSIGEQKYEWIPANLPNSISWSSNTYGNEKYICVADGTNKYIYSTNGITWTESTLPDSNYHVITYGNGKFLIISSNLITNSSKLQHTALSSTNGVDWTSSTITGSSDVIPNNVIYGNGKFIFVAGLTAYYSSDGVSWSSKSLTGSSTYEIYSTIAYGNGVFVTVNRYVTNQSANYAFCQYSLNGEDWIKTNIPVHCRYSTSISYGANKFVVVTDNDYILYSSNAITWHSYPNPYTDRTLSGNIIYGGNKFVIPLSALSGNTTGITLFSDDGLNWYESPYPEDINAGILTYGNNKYIAIQKSSYIFAYMETTAIEIPTQKGTLTYTGYSQSPTWSGYDTNKMTMSGDTSKVDAGTYTALFTPKSGYQWSDGTKTAKNVTWNISKASVPDPVLSSTSFVYNGTSQGPTLDNVNTSIVQVTGTTSAVNAGSYPITFSISNTNYYFANTAGNENLRSVSKNWFIDKANSTISISPDFASMDNSHQVVAATLTYSGGNELSYIVPSNFNSWVMVKLSGNTLTITAISSHSGAFDITVKNSGDENHYPSSDYIYINYQVTKPTISGGGDSGSGDGPDVPTDVSKTLDENSWDTISKVSESGQAANYWSVGDTKSIILSGKIGSHFSATNDTIEYNLGLEAFIIGFDHNKDVESPDANRIHFQIGKLYGENTLLALIDDYYKEDYYLDTFSIDSDDPNFTRGWDVSGMNEWILGNASDATNSFMQAMSSDLKSVLKTVKKYTHNIDITASPSVGVPEHDFPVVQSDVTGVDNYLSLLSEYELFGEQKYANIYEQEKQAQYEYYASGNSKVFYGCNDKDHYTGTSCYMWLRSPAVGFSENDYGLYCCTYNGDEETHELYYSLGIAPIFFV